MTRKSEKRAGGADFEVGYGKPPAHSRFKPGQSGNPKGKRAGRLTVNEQISRLMQEPIDVSVRGQPKRMSRQEAMLTTIANNAIKGDLKAATFLHTMQRTYEDRVVETIDPQDFSAADQAILESYMAKRTGAGTQSEETQIPENCPDDSLDHSKDGLDSEILATRDLGPKQEGAEGDVP